MPSVLSPLAEELTFQYMRRADRGEVDRDTASAELQEWIDVDEITAEERNRILHVFEPCA